MLTKFKDLMGFEEYEDEEELEEEEEYERTSGYYDRKPVEPRAPARRHHRDMIQRQCSADAESVP